jgi:hypothetical protein
MGKFPAELATAFIIDGALTRTLVGSTVAARRPRAAAPLPCAASSTAQLASPPGQAQILRGVTRGGGFSATWARQGIGANPATSGLAQLLPPPLL